MLPSDVFGLAARRRQNELPSALAQGQASQRPPHRARLSLQFSHARCPHDYVSQRRDAKRYRRIGYRLSIIGCVRLSLALLLAALLPMLSAPLAHAAPAPLFARATGPALATISGAALAAAGWADVDPRLIAVTRQGGEIAAELNGQDDGQLDAADQLRFLIGEGTRWSREEVYTLTLGTTAARRGTLDAQPSRALSWEEDVLYLSSALTTRGDRWFARELRLPSRVVSATIELPSPLASGQRIVFALAALTTREHRLVVSAGGKPLGEAIWTSSEAMLGRPRLVSLTTTRPLPAGLLVLDLELVGEGSDSVLLDRISFPGLNSTLPTVEPPLAPASATLPSAGAHQVIISHATLLPALAPLVAARKAQGITLALADVEAIYAAYSGGERTPEAIRAFLRATQRWSPAPTSALLVGAGSVQLRTGEATLIPPYLVDSDPKFGEVPCDSCFARFASDDVRRDPLPALAVGRLPARTLAEAEAMVAKILANHTPPPGDWASRALAVADNDRDDDGNPDPAGPFSAELDATLALLLPTTKVHRFLYDPAAAPTSTSSYATPEALRRELLKEIDAGAGLLIYSGHASPWQWAFTTPNAATAYLFSIHDLPRTNGARLPILLSLGCLSGQWANPIMRALDEQLVVQADGGALAALTPSGSAVNSGHRALASGMIAALNRGTTLGEAYQSALTTLLASGKDNDLAYSYNLLGDPLVRLPQPRETHIYLPLMIRQGSPKL